MNLIKKSFLMSVCVFLMACSANNAMVYKANVSAAKTTAQSFVVAVDDDYPPYDFF